MTAAINDLLLVALQRSGKPLDSGAVLDAATGIAQADGWSRNVIDSLNRKSVSKRLANMAGEGIVRYAGERLDERGSRMTPLFAPAGEYDAAAVSPPAPPMKAPKSTAYDHLSRTQLITLLEVHDDQAQMISRFERDLNNWRATTRAKLMAVGLVGEG